MQCNTTTPGATLPPTRISNLSSFTQVSPATHKSPQPRPSCRRRNSAITWDPSTQVYVNTDQPSVDQFQQFLYQSHHVGSPQVHLGGSPQVHSIGSPSNKCTPKLILESPSDTESITRTYIYKESKSPSPTLMSRSPPPSPRANYIRPAAGRRTSLGGDFLSVGRSPTPTEVPNPALLMPQRARQHSLGDIDSQEESYLVRSFAFEGQRVVNKGDFVASRRKSSVTE